MTNAQFKKRLKEHGGDVFWITRQGCDVILKSDSSTVGCVLRHCPTESAAKRQASRYSRWLP